MTPQRVTLITSGVADPDGHVWETAHNPFWELNPDGSLTLEPMPA